MRAFWEVNSSEAANSGEDLDPNGTLDVYVKLLPTGERGLVSMYSAGDLWAEDWLNVRVSHNLTDDDLTR